MRLFEQLPDGLLEVPLAKGAVLLLTPKEFMLGVKRGKWWRRRQAMLARDARRDVGVGSTISTGRISP